jgi:hypothetical protein
VYAPSGPIGRYPLTLPLLIAPWLAITPRAAFALGVLAAVGLTYWTSRLLEEWGRSPSWALVVLAHPTLVIVSRTIMADVVFSACTVGAWLALRRRRVPLCVLGFALLSCIKPTGALVGAGLILGEALRAPAGLRWLVPAALGCLVGVLGLLGMNLLTTGSWRFGYARAQATDVPAFGLRYVGHNLRSYAPALLLCPPLLVFGVVPLWRRRELGALCASAALGSSMIGYFFVDWGRSWLESLVLAPRLILPVVCLLLVGYADLLAGLAARRERLCLAAVCAAAVSCALAVSLAHRRWQEPLGRALASAARLADHDGARRLALTQAALKQGLLYAGETLLFDATAHNAAVVLCSTATPSHRLATERIRCNYLGYRVAATGEGFAVLVRTPEPRAPYASPVTPSAESSRSR